MPAPPAPATAPLQPATPSTRTGLAVTSLVGGIVAVVGCWIPYLGLGSLLPGLLAGGLGLAVLRAVRRGRAGGRGMAIAGLVTSSVAVVVAVTVTVAAVVGAGGPSAARQSLLLGVEEGLAQEREQLLTGPAAALGSQQDVGGFVVAVTSAETIESAEVDAVTGEVLSSVDYVLMDVSVANASGAWADPQEDLLFVVVEGDRQVTLGNRCAAVAPPAPDAYDGLAAGAVVVVPICFDIDPNDVPGSRVGISSAQAGASSMALWELEPRVG